MKKKLAIMALFILMVFPFAITPIYANYQSIGTKNAAFNDGAGWIMGIRQMESAGHGMGLTEIIDTDTGLATTASNNIDVHMQKNTEYGAIAILGVSEYGKQGIGEERYMHRGSLTGTEIQASTTGNLYGIYEMGYMIKDGAIDSDGYDVATWEWTAAGGETFLDDTYPNLVSRYVNRYSTYDPANTDLSTVKRGDATIETMNWHTSSYARWLDDADRGLVRSRNGAFSYVVQVSSADYMSRAVAVVHVGV